MHINFIVRFNFVWHKISPFFKICCFQLFAFCLLDCCLAGRAGWRAERPESPGMARWTAGNLAGRPEWCLGTWGVSVGCGGTRGGWFSGGSGCQRLSSARHIRHCHHKRMLAGPASPDAEQPAPFRHGDKTLISRAILVNSP